MINTNAKDERQPFCFGVRKTGTLTLRRTRERHGFPLPMVPHGEARIFEETVYDVFEIKNFVAAGALVVTTGDGHVSWFNIADWDCIEFTPTQRADKKPVSEPEVVCGSDPNLDHVH